MSVFEKYNRMQEFPTYQVEYAKAIDFADKGSFPVTFIGINNNSKYGDGRQSFVDILTDDDKHVRVNLGGFTIDDIEEMTHDSEAMQEVKDGKVTVEFKKHHSDKNNRDFAVPVWKD